MLHLTKEELTALRNIMDICIEQYESSGGDIDYTGLDREGINIMRSIRLSVIDKLQQEE